MLAKQRISKWRLVREGRNSVLRKPKLQNTYQMEPSDGDVFNESDVRREIEESIKFHLAKPCD